MAVLEQNPIASSTANGATTVFPHDFKVLEAADLQVRGQLGTTYTTFVLGVDYTVSGLGTNSGAVVFLSAPAAGMVITRTRRTKRQRLTDYQENGDLPASTLNRDLDRLVLMAQEAAAAVQTPDTPTDALRFDLSDNGTGSKGAGMIGWGALVSYAAGTVGAIIAALKTLLDRNVVSIDSYGAVADGATDNTTAIQAAIDAAYTSGRKLRIPANAADYVHAGTLTIPYDATQTKALRITGDSDINYYNTQAGSRLRYTGSGYAFDVQGRGVDVSGANSGSPVGVTFERLSITGTASALGAIRYRRAWYGAVRRCGFWNFSSASNGVVTIDSTSGGGGRNGFAGEITVEKNWFANSGRCVLLTGDTGGVVNVVRVLDNVALDQQFFLAHNFGASVPYSLNVVCTGNHCEGTLQSDVYSQGVAGGWVITGNYFEQNNNAQNLPRIDIAGSNNTGITITGNTFSKQLQAAGQSLARVANAKGVTFTGNISNYGGSTDRWSIDLQTCTQVTAEPVSVVGAVGYPVLMNNVAIFSGRVADTWRQVPAGGSGGFVGISSGDGYPGGTVCTVAAEHNKTNGMVTMSFRAQVTTKSASGTSLLIGLLPFPNNGGDVVFPVYATSVTGTRPFWAILPAGQSVATVYDNTGAAVNYQTAIAVGSVLQAQFSYLTQQ